MALPALAGRLGSGEILYCGWVMMPAPPVAEIIARSGFDGVILDMQHGLLDTGSVARSIDAVALAGKPTIVRVALGDDATAARALDMGAEAIIAPMINSVEDAQRLAAATKYPPVGERSWGPVRAMTLQGVGEPSHYLGSGNRTCLTFAMIETVRALDALDAILAVEGIDGVFVGPMDFSVSLSAGRRIGLDDPAIEAPLRHIAERTGAAGKIAGIYAPTGEWARTFRGFGYRLIAIASDQAYLASGAAEALKVARGA